MHEFLQAELRNSLSFSGITKSIPASIQLQVPHMTHMQTVNWLITYFQVHDGQPAVP